MRAAAAGLLRRYTFDPEHPNLPASFRCVRAWSMQPFIKSVIQLKTAFYNHGLTCVAAELENREAVREWWEESRLGIRGFITDVWREFLTLDNVVMFWRTDTATPAITLQPERCQYTDEFGLETLKYFHGVSADTLQLIDNATLRDRYRKAQISIGWDGNSRLEEEQFRVVKWAPLGWGFGVPSLMGLSMAFLELESMELGEASMAMAMRTVMRHHKLGHAITAGPRAGLSDWFWKKKRGLAVKTAFKDAHGLVDFTSNFDHAIEFPWPDPKYFNSEKWESPLTRFVWWSGPVGWMLTHKGVNNYLLQMLKPEAALWRERIEKGLTDAINGAFAPPARVALRWSNRCFSDARIGAEMLKYLLQVGAVSYESALTEHGYVSTDEWEQKRQEMALEKESPGLLKPIYDAAHGVPESSGGRPAGTKDPEGSRGRE